jgi:hypothetical protein
LPTKKVTRRGEDLRGQITGEDYFPLLLIPILFIISKGLKLKRGLPSPPPPHTHLCGSSSNAFESFFLFSFTLPFIFGVVGLPPSHILGQGDDHPPHERISLRIHPRPYNMSAAGVKKAEIDTIKQKKPEWTHPGTDDPVPQGNRAGAGVSIYPKSKDPLDPGMDLHICQLG